VSRSSDLPVSSPDSVGCAFVSFDETRDAARKRLLSKTVPSPVAS
jgi:hypothetical protein